MDYRITEEQKERNSKSIKLRREITKAEYKLAELKLQKLKLHLGL